MSMPCRILAGIALVLVAWSLPAEARVNFCGTAAQDIPLFNYGTRQLAVWCDAHAEDSQIYGPVAPNWMIEGIANFDGGATSDVLLYNFATSQVSIWPGGNAAAGIVTGTLNTAEGYQILKSFGDVNGDGKDDLIVYSPANRNVAIWYSAQAATSAIVGQTAPGWAPYLVADVNGDGNADLILFNKSQGTFSYWLGVNNTLSAMIASPGYPWEILATGSFASTPPACDIVWYNILTGEMATSQGCASTVLTNFTPIGTHGFPEDIFMVENVGGDAHTDLVINHVRGSLISYFVSGVVSAMTPIGTYNSAQGWNPIGPYDVKY